MRLNFPDDFSWGTATSSYQIEGAVDVGGRGPSIWDTFSKTPGKVLEGDTGDIACDHYHRWEEDIALLKRLGVTSYRFSIAWSRILPTGLETTPNPEGLAFYNRLIDALLEAGIEPWVTLYHWDLPQTLQDQGGWPSREILARFVHYADVVSQAYGDRVRHWITSNEPWVAAMLGHETGAHAPGIVDKGAALAAAHHILVSHGMAVPVIRRNAPNAKVGITLNLCPAVPASPSAIDARATRLFDGYFNRWYLDPLYGRGYPMDRLQAYVEEGWTASEVLPFVEPGDMEHIAVETDFLGINYYSRAVIRGDEEGNLSRVVFPLPKSMHTDFDWEVHPDSLYNVLCRLHTDYEVKDIVITENGCAYPDGPDEDKRIHDDERVHYFKEHLIACHRAIEQGVPLTGYFAWSLMDNFEWAEGYSKRFGLLWVDFETGERIPKESYHWYARTIAQGGVDRWSRDSE